MVDLGTCLFESARSNCDFRGRQQAEDGPGIWPSSGRSQSCRPLRAISYLQVDVVRFQGEVNKGHWSQRRGLDRRGSIRLFTTMGSLIPGGTITSTSFIMNGVTEMKGEMIIIRIIYSNQILWEVCCVVD